MANYLVTLNEPGKYNVGVDYEIPSKSIQYGNIILGKTPVQDGSEVTFSLTDQGAPYSPNNGQQLIVTKNGLFLDPANDYTISGDKVVFTTAPATNDDVVIIALAAAADLTRTVNYVIDSASLPMQTGDKGKLTIDSTLDLHGLSQKDAYFKLKEFIEIKYNHGQRYLLVITGKGNKDNLSYSERKPYQKIGILRSSVPKWLDEDIFKSKIISHQVAFIRHGGEGARYIFLRKHK